MLQENQSFGKFIALDQVDLKILGGFQDAPFSVSFSALLRASVFVFGSVGTQSQAAVGVTACGGILHGTDTALAGVNASAAASAAAAAEAHGTTTTIRTGTGTPTNRCSRCCLYQGFFRLIPRHGDRILPCHGLRLLRRYDGVCFGVPPPVELRQVQEIGFVGQFGIAGFLGVVHAIAEVGVEKVFVPVGQSESVSQFVAGRVDLLVVALEIQIEFVELGGRRDDRVLAGAQQDLVEAAPAGVSVITVRI